MVGKKDLVAWLEKIQSLLAENREYLTQLDSDIGDADHGTNMCRGFDGVVEKIQEEEPQSPAALLKDVAMTLIKKVGGASGPLYGSFFLKAGTAVSDREELDADALCELFEAGVNGLVQRGKAQRGDKTMLDAWFPALEALKEKRDEGIGPMMKAAAEAAEEGMKATIPMQARKGRASYLGERSIGHQDPGATSTHLIVQAAAELWS